MDTRKIAEEIYNDLKNKGAEIGNASILIIKNTLDKQVKLFAIPNDIKSVCGLRNSTICHYRLYDNECHCKTDCDFKQTVL
jgi:hypothetical protein